VLSIPTLKPPERPAPQKPGGLRLKIDGTAPIPYYNGGPDFQTPDYRSPDDAPTLRPFQDTTMPNRTASEPLDSLDSLIKGIDNLTTQPLSPQDDNDFEPDPSAANPGNWSDDVIEELQRLGEGAGGAVHKVKDKRSGKIIARKTITTREAPRQLLREVHIMTTTQHINIIRFYGAYISPSTSEVKILMEYCEGGSLEAVGKRLRDHGAVVGEKVAGRLAEGVSLRFRFKSLYLAKLIPCSDSSRACLSPPEKDYTSRHQALEYPLDKSGYCKTVRFWCLWGTRRLGCTYFYGHEFLHGCQQFYLPILKSILILVSQAGKDIWRKIYD